MVRVLTSLAVAVAICASGCGGEGETGQPLPSDELYVTGAGSSLRVRVVGDEAATKTVVLLHGGPGFSSRYLDPFLELADGQMRVVTYDQRGAGDSTVNPPSFRLEEYAWDLEAVRVALALESMHLVAHDHGGLVAYAYLASYPERVASLTIANGWSPSAVVNAEGFINVDSRIAFLQQSGIIPNPLPADVGDDCSSALQAIIPAYMFDPEAALPGNLSSIQCRRSVQIGSYNALYAMPYDYTAVAQAYVGPAFVIFGKSTPFGAELGDASASALSSAAASYVVLPTAGHFPWYEPVEFVDQIGSFLAALP